MTDTRALDAFPVVLQANRVQFAPGERLSFPRVESRMVLMCLGGTGAIRVNRTTHEMTGGALFVLPWRHSIAYAAGEVEPFLVGGAHLVPRHDAGKPVEAEIPHGPLHPLSGSAWRADDVSTGSSDVLAATTSDQPGLYDVTTYAISVFRRSKPSLEVMRALGHLLGSELAAISAPAPQGPDVDLSPDLPQDLRRVLAFVDRKISSSLGVRELADVAGVSESTLNRRFRHHLGTSPLNWVADRRVDRATELLRATSLPIAQIARRVGVPDPYYFSRLFRQRVGEPPSAWRRSHHLL